MLGLFGLSLHAANIPFWKNQNFEKYFLFFWKNIKKIKKKSKISISMKKITLYKKLFIGLSAFKKKISDPKFNKNIFIFLPFCAKLAKLAKNPQSGL